MNTPPFSKQDLKSAYETYFEGLRNFLFYKSGDMALAEDLVQEVFIKVWEKRNTIEKVTLKSLLYTIAGNLLINHFNHLRVVKTHADQAQGSQYASIQTPQFEMEEREFGQKLNNILQKLPDGSREVFLMNRIDKVKYDEIASRLDISVKAVEKRMSKALNLIKQELGRKL
jgi:RNA polymerase sigma-70 factor (ECF subfamily)